MNRQSKTRQRGGSLASEYVMALTERPCNVNFPLPEKVNFSVQEIVANYGTVYKTTGGSAQKGGFGMANLKSFVKQMSDNRVLDIYLKYLGITLLTPATLVPIALIMGKETFQQVVNDMKKNDKIVQDGGEGFLDIRIPIIDSNLVGNGLKLAGLTALNVSPYTLVPLGVLMYIYDKFSKGEKQMPLEQFEFLEEQIGGLQKGSGIATVLPPEFFGRKPCSLKQKGGFPNNNLDTPALRQEVFGFHPNQVDNSGIQRPFQQGGTCLNSNLDWTDVGDTFRPHTQVDNSGIQRPFQQGGTCLNSNLDWTDVGDTFRPHTQVDNSGIQRPFQQGGKQQKGGTRSVFGSDVPPNLVQQGTRLWSGQSIEFPRGDVYVNNDLQITNHLPAQSDFNPPYHQQIDQKVLPVGDSYCGATESCGLPQAMAGGKKKTQKGSGSDWVTSLYSRGPVNTTDMDPAQFAMFNKTSPYITNRILAGSELPSSKFYDFPSYANTIDYKPLFMENIVQEPASNTGSGIHPSNF
jgi:hypothetical protein